MSARVMDGENLDIEPRSFDAVISRLGLMFFPDLQKALAGMRDALRDGGRLAAIVYSPADRNQFFSLPVSIVRRRASLRPPLPGQPGPFSLGAPGLIEAALENAGFHAIETRLVDAPLRMPSTRDCVRLERESFGALTKCSPG